MSDAIKAIGAGIALLFILAALIFGGWEAGWWFTTQNVNRTTNVIRHSNSAQQSDIDATRNGASAIAGIDVQLTTPGITPDTKAALKGQRTFIVNQTCGVAQQIDVVNQPPDVVRFIATECH